jgi:hypothetical protein
MNKYKLHIAKGLRQRIKNESNGNLIIISSVNISGSLHLTLPILQELQDLEQENKKRPFIYLYVGRTKLTIY